MELAPGLQLVQAFKLIAELEYWAAPHTSSASRPPFVVWRLAHSEGAKLVDAEIADHVRNVIRARTLEWELRRTGKNWLLAPKRFLEIEDSRRFRLYSEALSYLERADPEFGIRANDELRMIAADISGWASTKQASREHR